MPNFVISKRGPNGTVMADHVDTGERVKNASELGAEALQKAAAEAGIDRPAPLTAAQAKKRAEANQRRGNVHDVMDDDDPELEEFLREERELEARLAERQAAKGDTVIDEQIDLTDDEQLDDDADIAAVEAARAQAEAEAAAAAEAEAEKAKEKPAEPPTFPCPHCEFAASTEGGLKRHIGAKHAEEAK